MTVVSPRAYKRPTDPGSCTVAHTYHEADAQVGLGLRRAMAYAGGSASYGYDAWGRQ